MEVCARRTATRLAIVWALVVVVACALGTPGSQTGAYAAPVATGEPGWQEMQVPVPAADMASSARLNAISAVSGREIWAVGSMPVAGSMQPLIERWDGQKWQYIQASNSLASSGNSVLYGVSARTSDDLWAVGTTGSGTSNLLVHYDGQKWTASARAFDYNFTNEMHGVIALSADDVWAVGYGGQPPVNFSAVAIHWDGTRWQPVSPPHSGARSDFLYAITGRASNDLWAVGYSTDYRGRAVAPYMAHWDGVSWKLSQGNAVSAPVRLYAATELAPDDVYAVGRYGDTGPSAVLHYDGKNWTSSRIPTVTSCTADLHAVAGQPARDLWVAGSQQCGAAKQRLALYQDGSGWSARPFRNQAKNDSEILGMTLIKNNLWVVGYFNGPFAAYYPLNPPLGEK